MLFLTSSSSSSPSFSSEQAHKTLSTLLFFTMCGFLLEAPIFFYVLSLPCFCHYYYLLRVVLYTPMCSPCYSSSVLATCGCHMNSQCVGIRIQQAHTYTQHFFFVTMCDFFAPNRFFVWLHCRDCNFPYCHCFLHCCKRKKRRIQCTQVHLFHQYFL